MAPKGFFFSVHQLAVSLDGRRVSGNTRQHQLKVLMMEVAKVLTQSGNMREYIENYNKIADIDIKFKGV